MSHVRRLGGIFVLDSEAEKKAAVGYMLALPIMTDRTPWRVTIEPDSDKRTVRQNARMWSIFTYISENVWVGGQRFSKEAWHDHYCAKFIGTESTPDGGNRPLGSSGLNTKDHGDFTERVQADAALEHDLDWTHWEERR